MKAKTTIAKRLMSLVLCLALVLTILPASLMTAFAAESSDNPYYNRVVDVNTMDNWKKVF